MPELHDLLATTAADLQPATVPSFDVVQRRVVARRRRRVLTGLSTGATVAVVAVVALQLSGGQDSTLRGPVASSSPSAVAAEPPPGTVLEPRPYRVPTTPATDRLVDVTASDLQVVGGEATSVPWKLIRLWDAGRSLAIAYRPGCDGPGAVHFVETPRYVVVQVVDEDGPGVRACANTHRATLRLSEPLGDRALLHAPTTAFGASLAERFDAVPAYPGEPWVKDGQLVPTRELTLAAGPEHCGWQAAAYLGGAGLAAPRDDRGPLWVRDPKGVLEHFPRARAEFQAKAVLPSDAAPTGYAQGRVELWTAPSDAFDYVYLVNADSRTDIERWVRGGGGCA